jgi:hypothetical protein
MARPRNSSQQNSLRNKTHFLRKCYKGWIIFSEIVWWPLSSVVFSGCVDCFYGMPALLSAPGLSGKDR